MALSYIDKDAMIAAFGEVEIRQLTDRSGVGSIVDAVLERAMETAESEANSYVGAAYAVPLAVVPPSLASFTCDIARFYLYDNEPTETVQNRYDRAVAWLRDVSRGVVSLGLKPEEAPVSSVVVVNARAQVFSGETFAKMGPKFLGASWPTA